MTFIKMQGAGTAIAVTAALLLGACAPLPQQNGTDTAAASAASATQAAQAPARPPAPPAPPGEQRLMLGSANGSHLLLKTTPPSQVCDDGAFADGVRYGYALTWNRLVSEDVRNGGKAKRKFDAS